MSETLTAINAVEELLGWGMGLTDMYTKDVKALTPETFTKTYGEKTRSVASMTGELVAMLNFATDNLLGKEAGFVPPTYTTIDEACAGLTAAVATLSETVRANTDKLGNTIMAPWQQEITLYQLSNIAINHIWYHDGQINFIQLMEGDDQMHWM